MDIVIVFGTPQIRSGAGVLSNVVYHAHTYAHKPAHTHSPPPPQMEGAQSKKELALEAKLREVVAFAYKVFPSSFPHTPGARLLDCASTIKCVVQSVIEEDDVTRQRQRSRVWLLR